MFGLFNSFSHNQIIAALGGTTFVVILLAAILLPGFMAILQPIVSAIVAGIVGAVKYLWKAFMYISQSAPALVFLLVVSMAVYAAGKEVGAQRAITKVHTKYYLMDKNKYTKSASPGKALEKKSKPLKEDKPPKDTEVNKPSLFNPFGIFVQ